MHSLIELDSVDSTNSWAKRHLATLRTDAPTIIVARAQTHGRGRFDHQWLSPKDQNLYLTIAEPIRQSLEITHYAKATSLAIAHLLQTYGIKAAIKQPNDLLVDKQKICGILIEGTSLGKTAWAIVGIGLNVCMDKELLQALDRPATSMHLHLPSPVTVGEVRAAVIPELLAFFEWASANPEECQKRYVEQSTS